MIRASGAERAYPAGGRSDVGGRSELEAALALIPETSSGCKAEQFSGTDHRSSHVNAGCVDSGQTVAPCRLPAGEEVGGRGGGRNVLTSKGADQRKSAVAVNPQVYFPPLLWFE